MDFKQTQQNKMTIIIKSMIRYFLNDGGYVDSITGVLEIDALKMFSWIDDEGLDIWLLSWVE